MQDEVRTYLDGLGLKASDMLLVAVSGGPDSMALLHVLVQAGRKVAVAHCNYNLRGKESDLDQELVRLWCEQHAVVLHSASFETKKLVTSSGNSLQMVARDLRYAFFQQLMDAHGYAYTALAHHADDRIESLVMNVLRGTGYRGLQGMPQTRDRFIRPLIHFRKSHLLEYLKVHDVPFRNDASNAEANYQRNRVRLHLLPMLRQLLPNAEDRLLYFAASTERNMQAVQLRMEAEMKSICVNAKGECRIDRKRLAAHPFPFTVLREMISPWGFSSEQAMELLRHPKEATGEMSSTSHRMFIEEEQVIVLPHTALETAPQLLFQLEERASISNLRTDASTILMDAAGLDTSQFMVRKWQQGDRFHPFGMKGSKLVSDYFIDSKFSALEKERTWLLVLGDAIIWVIGHRMDDRLKVTRSTQKVLRISMAEA